ncbi:hypothetical protein Ate02nite_22830 [Paractinoplanes tereljensis]|uniref:Uncharacterized protein n=1 Tax=Paractinoplanes tereljensis TaxID=571912 RepID=A0A919NJC5_9ACTN|nr:hypothetical protein Ate02nite_22830 [Actinoplanes tereljensis]
MLRPFASTGAGRHGVPDGGDGMSRIPAISSAGERKAGDEVAPDSIRHSAKANTAKAVARARPNRGRAGMDTT